MLDAMHTKAAVLRRGQWLDVLVFALLLPAAIAALDSLALARCLHTERFWIIAPTYILFVTQTALFSSVVGSRVGASWLWWLVFGWSVVLVDLQVFTLAGPANWWSPAHSLGFAFGSAQIGLAIVWGTLGTLAPAVRLPTAAAGFIAGWSFCLALGDRGSWLVVLFWQCIATGAACLFLRWLGFRIESVQSASSTEGTARMQFSIRHLFRWTTGVAVVVGLGRLIGLTKESFVQMDELALITVYAPIFTLIGVVALWGALGRESWIYRLLLLAIGFPVLGALVTGFEYWSWRTGSRTWTLLSYSRMDLDSLLVWVTWASLSGFLFAAFVLVFRGSGHRLVRRAARLESRT